MRMTLLFFVYITFTWMSHFVRIINMLIIMETDYPHYPQFPQNVYLTLSKKRSLVIQFSYAIIHIALEKKGIGYNANNYDFNCKQ